MCTSWPSSSVARSTSMYSGRSLDRHATSTSVRLWLMTTPEALPAGDSSWLMKCSGTLTRISAFSSMRKKSRCSICCLYGCTCQSRTSTRCSSPSMSRSSTEEKNHSFLAARTMSSWSSWMLNGSMLLPYRMAGTWPARRRRRLAPFPASLRRVAVILWVEAMGCCLTVVEMPPRGSRGLSRDQESRNRKQPVILARLAQRQTRPPASVDVQRTDRLAEGDAPDGLGQQLGHRQLADLVAGAQLGGQRQGVGDDQLVQLRSVDVVDRLARQHRMHAVGLDPARALALERGRGGAQGAGGVDDVVDQHAVLALDITDDVHHRGHVGLGPALVDDGQVGVVQALGDGARAHHAADVGADHDQVVHRMPAPDVGQQHRRGIHVVDGNVEKALDLVGMQ